MGFNSIEWPGPKVCRKTDTIEDMPKGATEHAIVVTRRSINRVSLCRKRLGQLAADKA